MSTGGLYNINGKDSIRLYNKDRSRFFDQVRHQTTNASVGNKHFFTKYWHHQTYQNYEQPCQKSQTSEFQSHFSVSLFYVVYLGVNLHI